MACRHGSSIMCAAILRRTLRLRYCPRGVRLRRSEAAAHVSERRSCRGTARCKCGRVWGENDSLGPRDSRGGLLDAPWRPRKTNLSIDDGDQIMDRSQHIAMPSRLLVALGAIALLAVGSPAAVNAQGLVEGVQQ